jgi:hypothetical protein
VRSFRFLFLLVPARMRIALDRVERRAGLAALVGIAAVITILPIVILLAITIVGIPLIALEAAGVFVGTWLGTGVLALMVGLRLGALVWQRRPRRRCGADSRPRGRDASETVLYVDLAVTALVSLGRLGASVLEFLGTSPLDAMRGRNGGPPMPWWQIE